MTEEVITPPETPPEAPIDTLTSAPPAKDETPPEGEKPPETPPVIEPLTAEALTFPEGATADEAVTGEFLALMNNSELSPTDRANSLLGLMGKVVEAASEKGSAQQTAQQAEWKQAVIDDPDIGGNNMPQTAKAIGTLMDKFGDDATRAAFNQGGLGDNPDVVRFLSKIGSQFQETPPPNPGTPPKSNRDLADRLFNAPT